MHGAPFERPGTSARKHPHFAPLLAAIKEHTHKDDTLNQAKKHLAKAQAMLKEFAQPRYQDILMGITAQILARTN